MKTKYLLFLLFTGVTTWNQVTAQPLSLDSCKAYALENNKQLKHAQLKLNESQEVEKSAFTNFFPKVNAQFSSFYANDYLINIETPAMNLPVYNGNPATIPGATEYAYVPSMELQTLDYVNFGTLTATQPVYAGGRIRSGYKLANLGEEIYSQSLELSTGQIVVKTEEYYWTLVSLEAKKKTLESYRALLYSLKKDVQVAFDAGLIQKSDLLKVQLKLNEVEAKGLKLNNGIVLLKMALCQHIGREYSEDFAIQDTAFAPTSPEAIYAEPETALRKRNEFGLLSKMVDAEILQKKMAVGEYLPQLAVGVGAQYLDVTDKQNTFAFAFATLSIPISDWWGGSHKIKEHQLKVEIARNELDEKSELLKLQMEKAYKELLESYQQITVSQSLVTEAEEHLKVIRDNYEAGIMSTSDLLEAQAISQEAQDGLVDAQSTYQLKQVLYKQVIADLVY